MPMEDEIQSTTPKQTMAVMAVSTGQMIAAIAPRYQEQSAIIEVRFDLMMSHVRQLAYYVSEMQPQPLARIANQLQVLVDELKTRSFVLAQQLEQMRREHVAKQEAEAAKTNGAAQPQPDIPATGA